MTTAMKPSPKQSAPPEFQMPRPHLTQPVIWYPDVDDPAVESGRAAIVTEVGEENISLAIIYPGYVALEPKTAVRHVKDPNKDSARNIGQGVWDFAKLKDLDDGTYRALLEKRVTDLETKLREMDRAAADAKKTE